MKRRLPRLPALAGTSLGILATALMASVGSAQSKFDFATHAQSYLDEHGLTNDLSFEEFLGGNTFARVDIGAFDLRIPVASMAERTYAERVKDATRTLIDLQRIWSEWCQAEIDPSDWDDLDRWVKSWSSRKLSQCDGGEASLLLQLAAKEKVVAAATRLSEATNYPDSTARRVGNKHVTVLAPSRKDFLKTVAVAGLLNKRRQKQMWVNAAIHQGAAWFDWIQIIALENCSSPVDYAHPFNGLPLDESEQTGLMQHVADRGGMISLRKEFVRHGTHFFEEALGTNLVIATAGSNGIYSHEWELNYHTEGGRTEPYVRFIPGGNSAGGVLPKRPAKAGPTTYSGTVGPEIGHYRANRGIEFFKDPLRVGQKTGAKLAIKAKDTTFPKDKRPYFHVYSLKTHKSGYVTAPFLGVLAEGKKVPADEFIDDYEDFFRAYRSCFLNWLKSNGGGSAKESAELFAQLIANHGSRARGTTLDAVVEKVYAAPISDVEPNPDSLEWRFLTWLQKGK